MRIVHLKAVLTARPLIPGSKHLFCSVLHDNQKANRDRAKCAVQGTGMQALEICDAKAADVGF